VKPSDVARQQGSVALLRFDFQAPLEERLFGNRDSRPRLIVVPGPKGLCVPENYMTACETLAGQLRAVFPDVATDQWDSAISQLRERMERLSRELRGRVEDAGLTGAPVIASAHQAVFCKWLGLNVVATFSAADMDSPAPMESLVSKGRTAGVRFVIGNLQEGSQAGEALARHLDAKLTVFSNFPAMTADEPGFDQLVRNNLRALEQAAGSGK
jgi:ABC-type Zn uptake system ZnuABC Zn-binding protein ZnuA